MEVFIRKSVSFPATSSSPPAGANVKESSAFLEELNSANSFKHGARVAHKPKPSTSGNILYFINPLEIDLCLRYIYFLAYMYFYNFLFLRRQRPTGGDKAQQFLSATRGSERGRRSSALTPVVPEEACSTSRTKGPLTSTDSKRCSC